MKWSGQTHTHPIPKTQLLVHIKIFCHWISPVKLVSIINYHLFHLKAAVWQQSETPSLAPHLPFKPNMLTTYMENNWLSCGAIKRPQIPEYCCGRRAGKQANVWRALWMSCWGEQLQLLKREIKPQSRIPAEAWGAVSAGVNFISCNIEVRWLSHVLLVWRAEALCNNIL